MKSFLLRHKLLIFLSIFFVFTGCKQPETTVVEKSPTAAPPDTVENQKASTEQAGFRQLRMGEYMPIRTLDPLFADNASSMRAVQLMYEGLVRLNAEGEVTAGLAETWNVSEDSLEYTFHLRPDIYYHDSEVFSTGTGRRIMAKDVKYVFERMAQSGVPPLAAHQFMKIEGFEPYFQEQRLVHHPKERNLDGISGIEISDERTVTFKLQTPDPKFLKKLTTPVAVIYPSEAVGQTVQNFTPVGSGPFNFSKRTADSTLIFSKFQDYYGADNIQLNRVDIHVSSSEAELFKKMSKGQLYLLPQLGPQLMQSVLSEDGSLLNSYADRYTLQQTDGATDYTLRYNTSANLSNHSAQAISRLLTSDTTSYFDRFPANFVNSNVSDTVETMEAELGNPVFPSQIFAVYSIDPFVRSFLGSLSKSLSEYNTSLQMLKIRAPIQSTGLFFSKSFPLLSNSQWDDYPSLYKYSVRQVSLQRSEIEGLTFNQYPWWFDVRGLTLPADENLN